jgi:transcriptional regulator with XRE-family HTH domain
LQTTPSWGKKISQADLGKISGTSGDIIGRYERDIITPSIDVIIKVADALEVSIDFLVGKTNLELDNQTLKRIEEISILPADRKNYILSIIDMAIRDFKTQNAYSA